MNVPETQSFMYQKALKIPAESKLAILHAEDGVLLRHHIAFCYSHLTVSVSPVNLQET